MDEGLGTVAATLDIACFQLRRGEPQPAESEANVAPPGGKDGVRPLPKGEGVRG